MRFKRIGRRERNSSDQLSGALWARESLNSARQMQTGKKGPHCFKLNLTYKITRGVIFNLPLCIISLFRISKICTSTCFSFPQLFTGPSSSYHIYEIKNGINEIIHLTILFNFLRYLCEDIIFFEHFLQILLCYSVLCYLVLPVC